MIEILCIIAVLMLFVSSIITNRELINPAVIFSFLWLTVLLFYSFHFFGLYYAETSALLLIVLGVYMFNIGCFAVSKFRVKLFYFNKNKFNISEKRLNILYAISAMVLIYGAWNNIKRFGVYSALELRYGRLLNISVTYTLLRDFIAIPIVFLSICVAIAKFVENEKNWKRYLLISLLLIGIEFVAVFEQLCIYGFGVGIFYVLAVFVSKWKNGKMDFRYRRIKKSIKWFILAFIILFIILSRFRQFNAILQHIYFYFVGCVPFFSQSLEKFEAMGRNSTLGAYSYGITSLQGLLRPFFNLFEIVGFKSEMFDMSTYFYAEYLAQPMRISGRGTYNSFTTMFMYFYKDMGILAIILFSFIYGGAAAYVYKKYMENKNTYYLSIYLFIVMSIFFTYIQSPFIAQKFACTLYFFFIIRERSVAHVSGRNSYIQSTD